MKLKNTARTHYYEVTLTRNWGDTYDKAYISIRGKFVDDRLVPLSIGGDFRNTGSLFQFGDKNVKEISKQEFFERATPENIFRTWDSSIEVNKRLSNHHKEVTQQIPSWEKKREDMKSEDMKIKKESIKKKNSVDNSFNYQLLSRLQLDCDYFLGNGNRNESRLWAGNIDAQIDKMRELLDGFEESEKPEWISKDDIDNYEKSMKEGLEKNYMKDEVELEEKEL